MQYIVCFSVFCNSTSIVIAQVQLYYNMSMTVQTVIMNPTYYSRRMTVESGAAFMIYITTAMHLSLL